MKKYGLSTALAFLLVANAFAEDVAIQCEILETPTSTHDSWSITILNGRAVFFDNDHNSYATLVKKTETDGGSVYLTYQSDDEGDPFRINLEDPESLYGKYPSKVSYAELYLGRKHRPNIFECQKTTVEEAKQAFEE